MTDLKINIGTKVNLKRDAIITVGNSENNPVVTWEVSSIKYDNDGVGVDCVTFKGKKTLYRFGGGRIYSITGPVREYKICD